MADMTPDERGMDAIGWFIKTPPDSEEQDLLCDIAAAISEAVAAREREIVEIIRKRSQRPYLARDLIDAIEARKE